MLRIVLSFFFLISFITGLPAQSSLLKELQNKFDSVSNFSADFIQKIDDNINLSGKIFFKKENKIRLETKNSIIISNGETNWNYNSNQNKVIITEYEESDPSVFSLNKMIYDYPKECEISESINKDLNVLTFIPKENSTLNFDSAKFYLNAQNLIERVEIKGLSSRGLIKINFSNYKLNQNLPDSKFSFSPPEGSSVLDLR